MRVRTRFAPSPTGFLHVGGVRTALFAWLLAQQGKKHDDGEFILRIEDTDRSRHVADSEKHIMESLEWLGLKWDEGPFRQSERLDLYHEWAQKLIQKDRAYADPRSEDELNSLRADAKAKKKPFLIREYPLQNPPEWKPGIPLRFKSNPQTYEWHDEVMTKPGEVIATLPQSIDDFIVLKADGYPTYNFAHVIDDHLMGITHVVRSQEFIPSFANYFNLYDALDISGSDRPLFATLPFVLGPDGNKKLSKRDGAKDILDYKGKGYLPEALISFLATLGWNDGTEQEIFTADELIDKFSLGRVQRSGARFDEKRLEWVNGHFIRRMSLDRLYDKTEGYWPKSAQNTDDSYKKKVLSLVQERLKFLAELPELTNFFFEEPEHTKIQEYSPEMMRTSIKELEQSDFSEADLNSRLNKLLEELETNPAILFRMLSVALTGSNQYPPLPGMLHVLGRKESISRLERVIEKQT